MDVVLGIDTSCYTTSVAVADITTKKCVKYELLLLLPEKGEKGLRQSTALFFHIKNIPELMNKLLKDEDFSVKAVAVSSKPRPIDGSYMPVFEAGVSVAKSVAAALNVPCYETSHQENHIMAASNGEIEGEFFALHLSGGTTELLHVKPKDCGYNIKLISGTSDLSFGKLIDRIGVRLGLDFPCGKELEALAQNGKSTFTMETKLYSGAISLSGAEKKFMDAADKYSKEDIAASLFEYCGKLLAMWVSYHVKDSSSKKVLFAGGVSSNAIIRDVINTSNEMKGIKCIFAEPDLCRDNAAGTAMIGAGIYSLQERGK